MYANRLKGAERIFFAHREQSEKNFGSQFVFITEENKKRESEVKKSMPNCINRRSLRTFASGKGLKVASSK